MQLSGRLPAVTVDVVRRSIRLAATVAEVCVLLAGVWVVGQRGHAFTGFPKGYDATGHLSKAQFVMSNWPHISWNYEWYSGQPTFAGSYPPGYHVLLAFVAWSARVSLPTAMNIVTFGAIALLVVGLYAIVRAATASHLGALLAAGLLLAAPTMWSQNIVLGLYPRFTALAFLAPAVATAIVYARRGTRLPALGTVVLLAVSLSMHPIVGALGIALITAVVLVGPAHNLAARAVLAAVPVTAALAVAAYFYLPLALQDRSQGLFTNIEVPLTWRALGWPSGGSLDTLTPATLPLAVAIAAAVTVLCRRPPVARDSKVRLGTDVLLLSDPPLTGDLPETAGPDVRRFVRWHRRRVAIGYPMRLCLLFAGAVPLFFAYGFVGDVDKTFPYYINGLQPSDLLVYPACLCCAVIGIAVGAARARRWSTWRAGGIGRHRPWAGVARWVRHAWACGAVVVPLVIVVPMIGPATSINDSPVQLARQSVFPAAADGQRDYRVAGTGDSVTKWLNEYSDAPQDRGYDDHGALHFDWQNWLEQTLNHIAFTPAQRDFLLDWYGVKWVDTDTGVGDTEQYVDTTRFQLLASETNYATLSSYLYKAAKPIMSATNAPTLLVIGDMPHYDLLLRALSYADVGSDRLVPVRGPTSIDAVSTGELARFDTVLLYGATVGNASADATLLSDYVRGGGRLVVDAADNEAAMASLASQKNSPFPVATARDVRLTGPGWAWTPTVGDSLLDGVDLASFGPASYAGGNQWSVFAAAEIQPWAHTVLRAHDSAVLVAGRLGAGQAIWSGLGLPYHVDAFTSAPESAFLAGVLGVDSSNDLTSTPRYTATFVDAGQRRVDVTSGARGVLLKEQDAPDWQATVDGRRTPIYAAGPGMMWIPLPDAGASHVVDVRYRLSGVERLGYLVSAVALMVLLVLFLVPALWRRGTLAIGSGWFFGAIEK